MLPPIYTFSSDDSEEMTKNPLTLFAWACLDAVHALYASVPGLSMLIPYFVTISQRCSCGEEVVQSRNIQVWHRRFGLGNSEQKFFNGVCSDSGL